MKKGSKNVTFQQYFASISRHETLKDQTDISQHKTFGARSSNKSLNSAD